MATEYIILAGGIVIVSFVIFLIYKGGVETASHKMGNSSELAAKKSACEVGKELNMGDSLFKDKYNFSKSECAEFGITW